MAIALLITLFLGALAGAIALAAGASEESLDDSRAFLLIGTLIQQIIFAAVAIWFASRTLRPRAWHFGFRRERLGRTVGWAALGFVSYWIVTAVYVAVVAPDEEQETLDDLGIEDGTGWVIVAAILIIVLAPIAEEFFFRGFFYRSLRTKLPVLAAAGLVGIVFGAIHASSTPLELLVPLALLGIVFCLIYEKTGTLFAVIGLHAFNNLIAFGVQTDEWVVAGIVGGLMLAACVLVPGRLPKRPAPAHG
jgi:membrane protease YdiL (CAAX protease family)